MNAESQRIAIAETCGWKRIDGNPATHTRNRWIDPNSKCKYARDYAILAKHLPDYLNDLNAMHEAEKVLTVEQRREYAAELFCIFGESPDNEMNDFLTLHATAAQRAEAFLRTLGLWKEEAVSEATVEGLR